MTTRIFSTSLVQPLSSQSHPTPYYYALTPLDTNNFIYTSLFFGYAHDRLPPQASFQSVVAGLKRSLASVLDEFPMLAGRFDLSPPEPKVVCQYGYGGAVFLEASNLEVCLQDLSVLRNSADAQDSPTQLAELFLPDMGKLEAEFDVQHLPLVVQATRLLYGSVVLTLVSSHMLMDGASYELFQKAWRTTAAAEPLQQSPERPPLDFRNLTSEPSVMPAGWVTVPKAMFFDAPRPAPSRASLVECTRLHFSKRKVDALKAELRGAASPADFWVTTDEVLAALIWRAVIRARGLDGTQRSSLIRPTNLRRVLKPCLPDTAFGNLAMMHPVLLTAEFALQKPLRELIQSIRAAKERFDDGMARRYLQRFAELPEGMALMMDFESLASHDLMVNSWSKFESLGRLELGFGQNVFVSLPPVRYGVVVMMPSCVGQEEGVVAHVYLPESQLHLLRQDALLAALLANGHGHDHDHNHDSGPAAFPLAA